MKRNPLLFVFWATLAGAGVQGGVPGGVAQSQQQTIHDLRAVRKGDKVTLTWTQPRNSSGASGAVTICRAISSSPVLSLPDPGCTPIGHADPGKSKAGANAGTLHFTDTLDEKLQQADPPQFAIYRITSADAGRRVDAYSNSASVSLASLPEVRQLHSSLDQRGVYLIWEAGEKTQSDEVELDFRLWRQEKTTKTNGGIGKKVPIHFLHSVLHQDEGERWGAVDTTAELEKTYEYWLTPIARVYSPSHKLLAEVEGDDSGPLEVVVHDVFPPAMPEGLLVTAGDVREKRFVDLLWAPNTEPDLAGYNIYRREEGGELTRIGAAPAGMLSYQDKTVSAGHKYFYAISAIDLRGNESRKTPETEEVKP